MARYEVSERLGRGGMGEVFRALQIGAEGFSREVAIKRVARDLARDGEFVRMFRAEVGVAAQLSHPNIVQVLDCDEDDDGLFLAMELMDGGDLRAVLDGRLPAAEAVWIAAELLAALAYAHQRGIVHRDVSPHNVFLSRAGAVKLGDFGIARATAVVTQSTGIKGKIAYIAPEILRGAAPGPRSDVWAVGVLLHEMLSGRSPFAAGSDAETIARVLEGAAPPLPDDVPADVAATVAALLAPRPEERIASAAEAAERLRATSAWPSDGDRRIAALVSARSRPHSLAFAPTAARPTRVVRLRARWLAGLAVVAAAAVALVVWTGRQRATPAADAVPGDVFAQAEAIQARLPGHVLSRIYVTSDRPDRSVVALDRPGATVRFLFRDPRDESCVLVVLGAGGETRQPGGSFCPPAARLRPRCELAAVWQRAQDAGVPVGGTLIAWYSAFGEDGIWGVVPAGANGTFGFFFDDCGTKSSMPVRLLVMPETVGPPSSRAQAAEPTLTPNLAVARAEARTVLADAEMVQLAAVATPDASLVDLAVVFRGTPPAGDPARCLVAVGFRDGRLTTLPLRSRAGCREPLVTPPRCSPRDLRSPEGGALRLDYLAIGGRAVWLRQQAGGVYDPMPDTCN